VFRLFLRKKGGNDVGVPLVDTHCHLDANELYWEIDAVIARARDAGIRWCIAIGAGNGTDAAPAAVALAHSYEEVAACVGIHPDDASAATDDVMRTLADLAADARVVAVGETGLDYRSPSRREVQAEAFRKTVRLGRHVQRPIVLHTRGAAEDTIAILRAERAHEVGGIVHGCTEGVPFARALLDMNFDISLSPQLERHPEAAELARYVPRDRLLLETSAPYHPPSGTTRNEPAVLPAVAGHVAKLLGVAAEDLLATTSRNAIRRLGLDQLPVASQRPRSRR
jgi:TatD DNase family protein